MGFIAAALASKTDYDVIVVGSGAAGGQTAYTLTMEGARVLILEAGRRYSPEAETPMFQTPQQAPLRAAGTPDKPFGFHDATVDGGWQVPGEPYVKGAVIADGTKATAPGGSIIHEVGGAIMGADARRSVTNQWGQTWDVTNLSSLTVPCSPPTRTRTRRSQSWPWHGVRPTASSISCDARSCEDDPHRSTHDDQVSAGGCR
jgi:choline dehydrogenase-like flavoprotein